MDPISDMLTRIRNAQAVDQKTVLIPFLGLTSKVAEVLLKEGFIGEFKKVKRNEVKYIRISLKYNKDKSAFISGLKKVSKPGKRIYKKSREIKRVIDGYGIAIISTSQGLMTDKEARRQKMGGEVLCEIW